jgi:phosphoserine aminotransferase
MSKPYRAYNFSSGPATLPLSVLEQIQSELINYKNSGMSVLEMSHRSREFDEILSNAENSLKRLLNLNDDYSVLFLQGGASLQFSMIPMNLTLPQKPVEVIHTGYWTEMALAQLKKGFEHKVVATSENTHFRSIPKTDESLFSKEASYVHYCTNNTIDGTQWNQIPAIPSSVPLIADMSSDFLSKPIDVTRFGLIFAGAQKNVGPSGVCIVVIRKDLAERAAETLPTMLQYRTHIKAGSRYNTPPAFGIYVCGLVLNWIQNQGGLTALEKQNLEKANLLFNAIDSSSFYKSLIPKKDRSIMNVVFRIQPDSNSEQNTKLETLFAEEARMAGLLELKGHRAVGGLRASLYNAFPKEGVLRLIDFMKDFESKHS